MSVVEDTKNAVKNNTNMTMVFSAALGMALFGAVMYVSVKSGVAPLKDLANIAKGGK